MQRTPPQLVVDFEGRDSIPKLAGLAGFFDRLGQRESGDGFRGLRAWTRLPNPVVDATDAFVAEQRIPWPQFFQGPGWPWSNKWGIAEIPVLFVIDRRGRLRYVERAGAEFAEQRILQLLDEPRG